MKNSVHIIGILAAAVGIGVAALNITNILFVKGGRFPDLATITVILPAVAAGILLVAQACSLHFAQILQTVLVLGFGLIALEEYPEGIYGHSFLLLSWVMAVQYRILQGRPLIIASLGALLAAFIAISIGIARGTQELTWVSAVNIVVFDAFIIAVGAILYRDTLKSYLQRIRFSDTLRRLHTLSQKAQVIEAERERYLHRVSELEQQLNKVRKEMQPFPLAERGITPAETEVIRVLVERQCSDADIADLLNKSLSTVRVQMRSIFEKLGVESRVQVIELCRYNWD